MHSFLISVGFFLYFTCNCNGQTRFSYTREKMGSPFTIIFYDSDSAHANRAAESSFLLVDSLVYIFSDYINESELNRVSRSGGLHQDFFVSPALFDILLQSKAAYKASKGAFDITVGPLTKFWRQARKEKRFPADTVISAIKSRIGFDKIIFNKKQRSVKLTDAGMQLDLGGIAQGYIGQQVLDYLKSLSIKSVLINVSGDIAMGDPPPGKKGWTIGINMPESEEELQKKNLALHQCAVSTSGDLYQFIEHNGKRYSHIIDPRSGYGITSQKNVTVIAEDGTVADWLSTACSILPVKKALRLVKKHRAALIIAQMENNKIRYYVSKNIEKYYVQE